MRFTERNGTTGTRSERGRLLTLALVLLGAALAIGVIRDVKGTGSVSPWTMAEGILLLVVGAVLVVDVVRRRH